ncbi:MFS transporter [Lysobacter sp. KIS68-7]|uniref:MFS transporter n=1 Tax=Lysobacter sp. KIS68-7 TaxID=2904252 RepID=UPI001E478D39|nr:MFS transporter [Lysobacter sp. KIS68-7]UHQ19386.1 MFS transporter [Lysobacter sp. KIS68-7]
MNALATDSDPQAMSPAAKSVLLMGSAGFLFANLAAQVLGVQLGTTSGTALPAGGMHTWATAVYTLASFVGVATAQPIEQRVGTRMYFAWAALVLAAFGCLQALIPSQPLLLAMRGFEGFATGSFGPRAFLAAFLFCRNGRMSTALALAVFFTLVAGVIAFVMVGASGSELGQRGLFFVQFAVGSVMAIAGLRWLPRNVRPPAQSLAYANAAAITRQFAPRRRRRTQRHVTNLHLRAPAA